MITSTNFSKLLLSGTSVPFDQRSTKALFEPRRISQRLQPERGWSIWEHKSGIQRKYGSERSGWC